MNQQTKNTMLVVAILAGLLSLPTTWMTIRNAQFQGGMGEMFNTAFNNMTIDVTGLNGHVTFLVKTPIWLIVVLAIAASAMQLMQASQAFAVPQLLVWGRNPGAPLGGAGDCRGAGLGPGVAGHRCDPGTVGRRHSAGHAVVVAHNGAVASTVTRRLSKPNRNRYKNGR